MHGTGFALVQVQVIHYPSLTVAFWRPRKKSREQRDAENATTPMTRTTGLVLQHRETQSLHQLSCGAHNVNSQRCVRRAVFKISVTAH
ncbi:hypothetical protein GQ600_7785 [Phytophthora cactorum]|nr:hypothetical protein GQ600_7785 [Phytophthora cactorum]